MIFSEEKDRVASQRNAAATTRAATAAAIRIKGAGVFPPKISMDIVYCPMIGIGSIQGLLAMGWKSTPCRE